MDTQAILSATMRRITPTAPWRPTYTATPNEMSPPPTAGIVDSCALHTSPRRFVRAQHRGQANPAGGGSAPEAGFLGRLVVVLEHLLRDQGLNARLESHGHNRWNVTKSEDLRHLVRQVPALRGVATHGGQPSSRSHQRLAVLWPCNKGCAPQRTLQARLVLASREHVCRP